MAMNHKLTNTALSSIKSVSSNTNNLNATNQSMNMTGSSCSRQLSAREMLEYEEAFKFFDTDQDGYVETSEIGKLMRSVGLYPSENEIQQIQKSRGSTKFDLADFIAMLTAPTPLLVDPNINEQQMREAFRMFDSYGTYNNNNNNVSTLSQAFFSFHFFIIGNGFVNLMQMRNALQNLGEKLRDDEIDELIREADIDAEGNVNYEELVKILCRP